MSEEENNEQGEETVEETVETPDAAPAEETPAEQPVAEEPPAEEPPAEEPPAKAPPSEDSEPAVVLSAKQRRKLGRSTHEGEAGPPRSLEERLAERADRRTKAAASRRRYRAKQKEKRGEPGTGTPARERVPGVQKTRQGTVTSSKADKTISVRIESAHRHPAYEKVIRRSKTLHAHDERNEAGEGDTVRVAETRPMSKSKRWRLVEVIEKAR